MSERTRWLLSDYGEVISNPLPAETILRLADRQAEPRLVEALVRVDIAGWMTLNRQTLPALTTFATHTGVRLALLSNAPEPLAAAIDQSEWSASFDRRFYSCRLGLAKPDSAVYEAALAGLAATPPSVLFIDDRAENVLAATALGLRAVRFTSAEELPCQLDECEASVQ